MRIFWISLMYLNLGLTFWDFCNDMIGYGLFSFMVAFICGLNAYEKEPL